MRQVNKVKTVALSGKGKDRNNFKHGFRGTQAEISLIFVKTLVDEQVGPAAAAAATQTRRRGLRDCWLCFRIQSKK
jgi:hypothetical protein